MTEQKKYQYEWLYRAVVISLLTAGLLGGMNYVPKMVRAVEDLTFDSVEQKQQMKQLLIRTETLTPAQLEILRGMIYSDSRHMSIAEKESMIIIRENQKRIGTDLEEIKQILKSRR